MIWLVNDDSGLMALACIAAWLWTAYLTGRLVLDLTIGRVCSVEGVLWRHINRDSDSDEYLFLIAGRRLKVSKRTFAIAVDGATYRVYFLPRSTWVMNLELMTGTAS